MHGKKLLRYVPGAADQRPPRRNEHLVTKSWIRRNQSKGLVRLSDSERYSLARILKRLGRTSANDATEPDGVVTDVGDIKRKRWQDSLPKLAHPEV